MSSLHTNEPNDLLPGWTGIGLWDKVFSVITRRLFFILGCLGLLPASAGLPESTVFVGKSRYDALVARAARENWAALPIGDRTAQVGRALLGTPYVNYTLELDTRIEQPCVNFNGMDCWTFFEIALGTARALKLKTQPTSADLLRMIELDRYRGGKCTGSFISRLHHLEDWSYDNSRRRLVEDLTPKLPGARRLQREMNYMATHWRSFRQLKANPALISPMARIESEVSRRGIYYIPKNQVAKIEKYLQNGDIISIVTTWPGTYTSHVGLAVRDANGPIRFMHASRDAREVMIDSRLSDYLARFSKHQGIMVARPREL